MVPADNDGEKFDHDQCGCTKDDVNPCGMASDCTNRLTYYECQPTCKAGEKCQNQNFKKFLYPKHEVFKTSWGGWGLLLLEDIKKGTLVHEYVGEIVDQKELERRIKVAHAENIKNYYRIAKNSIV